MKKIINLLTIMILFIIMISCRKNFIQEFPNVLIINHAPELLLQDTLRLKPQIGTVKSINLRSMVVDYEGDDVSIKAISKNPDILTVSVQGDTLLNIYQVAEGITDIILTLDDGAARDSLITGKIIVKIAPIIARCPYLLTCDFYDFENGVSVDNIYIPFSDSVKVSTRDGSDLSSRIVQNGVMLWTTSDWNNMFFEFKRPLDLSNNPIIDMEYADWWSADGEWNIKDAKGVNLNIYEPAWDMVLNSSKFNTKSLDLNSILVNPYTKITPTGAVFDLTKVMSFTWEKNGGNTPPFDGTKFLTCKVRFIGMGKIPCDK